VSFPPQVLPLSFPAGVFSFVLVVALPAIRCIVIPTSYKKGNQMSYQVTETQNKTVTRIYNLDGPKLATITSFWDMLVSSKAIEGYEVTEN
jgi:hypothetical protein